MIWLEFGLGGFAQSFFLSLERKIFVSFIEGTVKLSYSQTLFQSNSCFLVVNLLWACFSAVSEIFVRKLSEMREKVSEN